MYKDSEQTSTEHAGLYMYKTYLAHKAANMENNMLFLDGTTFSILITTAG